MHLILNILNFYKLSGRTLTIVLSLIPLVSFANDTGALMSESVFLGEVPVVMSATRLSQSIVDSPIAVSVIDRQMIELSGAREIPELFRLVPGFIVGYHDGHTASVSNHMSFDRWARRMQVVVDGRTVYIPTIGGVPWADLALTLDDIEKIEVVRGPNSASYGSNSFLGVISITTRHAVLDAGTSVRVNVGDLGVRETHLRHGGQQGDLDYRVTVGYSADDGFKYRADEKRTRMLSFRGDYHIDQTDNLMVQFGASEGARTAVGYDHERSIDSVFISPVSPPRENENKNYYQQIKWERSLGLGEAVSVQLYHSRHAISESFITNPVTIDAGAIYYVIDPYLEDFSITGERIDLELQHTAQIGDELQLVWGGGFRDDEVKAPKVLGSLGETDNQFRNLFAHVEWQPDDILLLSMGAMIEESTLAGSYSSPRMSVMIKPTPRQSFRLSSSKAIRLPVAFEDQIDVDETLYADVFLADGTYVTSISRFEQGWLGLGDLSPERIKSTEFGYRNYVSPRFQLDARVYQDRINDLIVDQSTPTISGDTFDSNDQVILNRDEAVTNGTELEVMIRPSDTSFFRLGYAVTRAKVVEFLGGTVKEFKLYAPKEAVSLLVGFKLPNDYIASAGFYFSDEKNSWGGQDDRTEEIKRLDLRLAKKLKLDVGELEVAMIGRNVLRDYEEMDALTDIDPAQKANVIGDSYYLSARLSFD